MAKNQLNAVLNRYQLGEQIGIGGMGTVYRATDAQTDETVAIKVLRPEVVAKDPDVVERFRREAEALRQLNHPNIVKVLETYQDGDKPCIVMEYAENGSLLDLLDNQKQLDIKQALTIALDLADALTRAHRLQIIHRDIKPANIVFAGDNTPRLTDFGVAYMEDKDRVTQIGSTVGTLDYMSPDALNSASTLDARGDIWSFGVLLFEMLAGERPFNGSTSTEVLTAIMMRPTPDLENLRSDLPVGLVDLIYRMLEKDREARIPSIRLVGAELERIMYELDTGVAMQVPPRTLDSQRFHVPRSGNNNAKHNLPVQITPFVGRESELTEMEKLLDDPNIRLMTIVGPGGMGKTRLSLEAAMKQVERFRNGVYFVPLAPLRAKESIVPAMADAVGFKFRSSTRTRGIQQKEGESSQQASQLLDFLSDKELLLMIDNFEHMLDGAPIVSDILRTAPKVQVLATSRERLNLQEETVYRIEGMDFPQVSGQRMASLDTEEYSAVKLFMQSARRIRPDFELSDDDLTYVVRICELVQGMPLAIVLAAAWVEMLSLQEIVDEITNSTDFLETDMRNVPERHRSVRAVFDYSWNMLSDVERDVFMALAVFRGGCTREAAQAVGGMNGRPASLRTLTALVNKSLLKRDPDTGRYELHELLRQYAKEYLAKSGHNETVRTTHSNYYAGHMDSLERDLRGGRQVGAMNDLDKDLDNVRSGWQWAYENDLYKNIIHYTPSLDLFFVMSGRREEALEMFGGAYQYLLKHPSSDPVYRRAKGRILIRLGRYKWSHDGKKNGEKARDLLENGIEIVEELDDLTELPTAYIALAQTLCKLNKFDEAWEVNQENLRLSAEINDQNGLADANFSLGYIAAISHDDIEKAQEFFEKSRKISYDIGDKYSESGALFNLGATAEMIGNFDEANRYHHESLALRRELGNPFTIIKSAQRLAWTAWANKRFDDAESMVLDCLDLAQQHNLSWQIHDLLNQLSSIGYAKCEYERALQWGEDAQQFFDEEGCDTNKSLLHMTSASIGAALIGLGRYDEAEAYLITSLEGFVNSMKKHKKPEKYRREGLAHLLLSFSLLVAKQGQHEYAVEYLSIAVDNPHTPEWFVEHPEVATMIIDLRAQLGDDAFEKAWEQGKLLSTDFVIARLLGQPTDDIPIANFPAHIVQANNTLIEPLSDRELEVLSLIVQGLSNREIAEQLVIGISTVKKHINHIYGKLDVSSRPRAIVQAGALGLV